MAAPPPAPINGSTALLGLLGDPVRHSLSPAMHNAALRQLGLNWVYLPLPVAAAQLAAALAGLEALGCRGLNVTIPHKRAVAALCRQRSPLAERLGAVNTLVPLAGGGWHGTNTDVEGFLAPLRGHDWRGRDALVLGCGGSARAVVAGLVELGMGRIRVAARRRERLERFADDCRGWAPGLVILPWPPAGSASAGGAGCEAGSGAGDDPLLPLLPSAALVVNTTPVGMAAAGDAAAAGRCPLGPRALAALQPGCWVYDLIYTPRPTTLLQAAAARGCRTLDGLEMLVQQGAAALRLWSDGLPVPVDTMRAAALGQLEGGH